jgi:ADP-ribosyl-[dinitrogen reductase] hydrolase
MEGYSRFRAANRPEVAPVWPGDRRDRFRGALLGLAVGDAVGTTVEFKAPGTFARVTDMVGGGPFALPAGAWTDDTSMALCLAESLVKCGGFDPVDQLERYVRWYREGYWSSTGRCFDIGNATRAALQQFERTHESYPGDGNPQAAGNGPLMKLAPVALAYATHPTEAIRYAGLSARTTHGAPEALDACRYWSALLVGALDGTDLRGLIGGDAYAPVPGLWERELLRPRVAAVAAGSFRGKQPPEIRGDGYIVDALEAALWAVHSTDNFEAAVLAAVNLGDDADTTAAIAGQLAGAVYGVEAIPERWRDLIVMGDEIRALADDLRELATSIRPLPLRE